MMFALGICYLNGWAMAAADGANKEQVEWPPHPDRVFMALAAAWFETDEPDDEGAALRWLEGLDPPAINASDATLRGTDFRGRQPVSYVPANDVRASAKPPATRDLAKLKEAGLSVLPEYRGRNARHFPLAIPLDPTVYLIWRDAELGKHQSSLERLAAKVTNIGHSASLVQVWIEDQAVEPRWIPTDGIATRRLRVTGTGRLEYLRRRCNRAEVIAHRELSHRIRQSRGKEKTMLQHELAERFGHTEPVSLRPEPGLWQGYTDAAASPPKALPRPIFDDRLMVFALRGQRPALSGTLRLTNALRCMLLKDIAKLHGAATPHACSGETDQAGELLAAFAYPEWLSGHAENRAATSRPHLAFAALPFVAAAHADGHIMGAALILPRGLDPGEAARWLEPWLRTEHGLPREVTLFDGRWLEAHIELELREARPQALRPETWTALPDGASRWGSVTPVVLDRHFKGEDKWHKAAESVKDACVRIGLPRPLTVELHPVSRVRGVPRADEFPYLTRKSDGGRMYQVHAFLQFAEPVSGPVLIGAGRFRGYGLCRPFNESRHSVQEHSNG